MVTIIDFIVEIPEKGQVLWYMPIIPTLGSLRQENQEYEASLGYIVRLCLKNKPTTNKTKQNKCFRNPQKRGHG
jgi:hypothetical protein